MNRVQLCHLPRGSPGSTAEGTFLVLASGGVDSSTLLWLSAEQGLAIRPVHQLRPACRRRRRCCSRKTLRGSRRSLTARPVQRKDHAFRRDPCPQCLLVAHGAARIPDGIRSGCARIHAGTGYADCSPEFVDIMQRSFDFHNSGETPSLRRSSHGRNSKYTHWAHNSTSPSPKPTAASHRTAPGSVDPASTAASWSKGPKMLARTRWITLRNE